MYRLFLWYICSMNSENKSSNTKVFGLRAIIEAIRNGKSIDKAFIQKGLKGPLMQELLEEIKAKKISVAYVPIEKLDRLSKHMNHQGAVAQISQIEFQNLEDLVAQESTGDKIFLLLDGVSDVRNLGAIIRTAECSGVSAVVIPKSGSAPVNAETIKTSAGAAFNIPICKVDHIKDALFLFQAEGYKSIAATEKADDEVYDVDLKGNIVIVMGSEEKGINPSVLKMIDAKAKLPVVGNIESLNVSVACGVFLYESLRQRRA